MTMTMLHLLSSRTPVLLLAVLAAQLSAPLSAQLRWVDAAPTQSPASRYGHAASSNYVLFGGRDSIGNRLSDTWLLSGGWIPSTPQVWLGGWQQQQSAVSSTARAGHAMAYDLMTNTECMLFGGRADTGLSNETWRFANGQWQ